MKKNDNVMPFANDIQKSKNDFKQMIDRMEEEEFEEFVSFINHSFHEHLDEEFDEECDCEFCQDDGDCESPFSGEMINFKCNDCKKFTAEPVEFINAIYEETSIPSTECFHCEKQLSPVYYKSPDGKIFNS